MIVYLVSGEADIEPAKKVLVDHGKQVKHGAEVDRLAARALEAGGKYVVVAHGSDDGTVFWCHGVEGESPPWLWVGMEPPPAETRIYLYCCKAGRELSEYLAGCECLGHSDIVPMPVDSCAEFVLRFLRRVDELMLTSEFDRAEWRRVLMDFVTTEFERAVEAAGTDPKASICSPCVWLMLSNSLRA